MNKAAHNHANSNALLKERGGLRIKVCGMTKAEQVNQLNAMGVQFAGFIFYPKSPRYVFKSLPAMAIKKIKGGINKVGVFVNENIDDVLRTVDDCGLYLVQLHGDESPKYCEKIAEYITVIKAFRISENDNVLWKIKDYQEVVDMFLFDTAVNTVPAGHEMGYGGTGKKFNWHLLQGLNINKPFFLSGGIGMQDIDEIKKFLRDPVAKDLFAIDINSCFELMPGVKDIAQVKSFVEKLSR